MSANFFEIRKGISLAPQASDPVTASAGDFYYNTSSNVIRFYNGTTWGPVGGVAGANQSLSNLTSPTAINQDFIFSKSTPIITSANVTGANTSENLAIATGTSASGQSGELRLLSGTASASSTGGVTIASGNAGAGTSGNITLQTGTASSIRGALFINSSGVQINTTNSPIIFAGSGLQGMVSADAAGDTSPIVVKSGNSFSSGNSGSVTVKSGNATSGTRGQVILDGASINASSAQIKSVALPTAYDDAATKNYHDNSSIPNYISNGNAESAATTGWATYANAAATSPSTGAGGSPTVTFGTTTTSPLSGTNSFLLSHLASNQQGQGVSYDFTIDSSSRAKVLQISFDYILDSGAFVAGNPSDRTSTGDSDVTVWIYDVTNNTLIQPSTYRLYSNSSSVPTQFISNFQTSWNSTSYRLILHCGTTNTSAFALKLDSVKVAPTSYVYGTPVTDWQSFTPTGSWTTNATYTGKKRQVGDEYEYDILVTATGTPSPNVFLAVNIPDTIDTSKLSIANGSNAELGIVTATDTGTANYPGRVIYKDATSVYVAVEAANATYTTLSQLDVSSRFAVGTGDLVHLRFSVPILGKSSSVQMSDSTDTRIVDFAASNGSTQAITANVTNISATSFKDSHSAWSGTQFTVPTPGDYVFIVSGYSTAGMGVNLFLNGSSYSAVAQFSTTYSFGSVLAANLKAGDVLSLRGTTSTSVNYIYIAAYRLSGSSAISPIENIIARYTSTAGNSVGTSNTLLTFATSSYDSHGAYSTSTGQFTCPASGEYQVNAKVATNLVTLSTTQGIFLYLYKNGSQIAEIGSTAGTGGNVNYRVSGIDSVTCVAGDTLAVYAASAVATTLTTAAGFNYITFRRTGN